MTCGKVRWGVCVSGRIAVEVVVEACVLGRARSTWSFEMRDADAVAVRGWIQSLCRTTSAQCSPRLYCQPKPVRDSTGMVLESLEILFFEIDSRNWWGLAGFENFLFYSCCKSSLECLSV